MFGCPVDVDVWERENRVPLFPGKVNRWVLARTLRDKPTPTDLQNTLVAVFNKWFGDDPLDPAISLPFNPTLSRAGSTDAIVIKAAGPTPQVLPNVVKRREQLSFIPIVNGEGGVVFLEVSFNYRGQNQDRAWPVHTAPSFGVRNLCPVNADWMLIDVGLGEEEAPPRVPTSDLIAQGAKVVVNTVKAPIEGVLIWALTLTAGAAVVLYGAKRLVKS